MSWDRLKGEDPEALQFLVKGTEFLGQQTNRDNRSAVAAFTRAIEISQNAQKPTSNVTRSLSLGRIFKSDRRLYTDIEPESYAADAYYSRGDAHRALGDYQHALVDYTASLEKRWAGL